MRLIASQGDESRLNPSQKPGKPVSIGLDPLLDPSQSTSAGPYFASCFQKPTSSCAPNLPEAGPDALLLRWPIGSSNARALAVLVRLIELYKQRVPRLAARQRGEDMMAVGLQLQVDARHALAPQVAICGAVVGEAPPLRGEHTTAAARDEAKGAIGLE